MTCEDCLYYNFCANQYGDTDYFDDEDIVSDVRQYCNQAEDKTKYIKLPCKVGDTVYFIKSAFSYAKAPMKGTVIGFKTFEKDLTLTFTVTMQGSLQTRHFTERDLEKTVFITQEEAEQALKEVKEND